MIEMLVANEGLCRLSVFLVVLMVMIVWEGLAPRRRSTASIPLRWTGNLSLVALDTIVVRLVLPVAAVGVAGIAEAEGLGLLNQVDLPLWLAVPVAIAVLDLAIWGQHVAMHKVPVLWRLHRVHHSDVDFDATTALRFHPLEILISALYKMAVVAVLGAPAFAVILFEMLLSASALFTHGNVGLPPGVDRALRRLIVTPDMHRIHHSVVPEETDSNYGFSLSLWDRLFGTYRDQPRDGQAAMTIGLDRFRQRRDLRLDRLLLQPFRGP
jgi:sterol desaturase/sphingolipid hydroxylase (fatty acid hydroxylase superfamily)